MVGGTVQVALNRRALVAAMCVRRGGGWRARLRPGGRSPKAVGQAGAIFASRSFAMRTIRPPQGWQMPTPGGAACVMV